MWFNDLATIDLSNCNATKTKKKTILQNRVEFWQWFAYLSEMGINRYKLTGEYPDTLDERTILQALFWYGGFCLFNDGGVWLSLPCQGASDYTVYGYWRKAFVFGRNGYNKQIGLIQYSGDDKVVNNGVSGLTVKDKTGFYVQEKKFMYPLANTAVITADRLSDTMRSLDVMRNRLKTPYVFFAVEEMQRTVQKYLEDIEQNDKAIITTGVFDPSKVQVEQLDYNPENIRVARELVEWYLAQYLNLCGINSNPASDKQERLLVDEINANDQETENNVNSCVAFMNAQLDKVNEYTGWSMRMEVNYDANNKDIRGDFEYVSDGDDLPADGDASRPTDD